MRTYGLPAGASETWPLGWYAYLKRLYLGIAMPVDLSVTSLKYWDSDTDEDSAERDSFVQDNILEELEADLQGNLDKSWQLLEGTSRTF